MWMLNVGISDTFYLSWFHWGSVSSIWKIGCFSNGWPEVVTGFFLWCPLSLVTLDDDFELLVEDLEVLLDNLKLSLGLPGEISIYYGAVPCWSSCTKLSFVSSGSLPLSFRPTRTSVAF